MQDSQSYQPENCSKILRNSRIYAEWHGPEGVYMDANPLVYSATKPHKIVFTNFDERHHLKHQITTNRNV